VIKLIDAYVPPSPDFDHVYLIFEHMEKSLWKVGRGAAPAAAPVWLWNCTLSERVSGPLSNSQTANAYAGPPHVGEGAVAS
jgi:hypothetical protein